MAKAPPSAREGIVLVLNIAFLAIGLLLVRLRMTSIGIEASDSAHAIAKSNLTFLVLALSTLAGSAAALWRRDRIPYAIIVALFFTFVSWVLLVFISGQLWGS